MNQDDNQNQPVIPSDNEESISSSEEPTSVGDSSTSPASGVASSQNDNPMAESESSNGESTVQEAEIASEPDAPRNDNESTTDEGHSELVSESTDETLKQVQGDEETTSETPIEAENADPDNTKVDSDQTGVDEPVDEATQTLTAQDDEHPDARWYVVHTYSGHENRVATALKQRVESERLDNQILDILVPTQDKIEIRSSKKTTVKEKIFPGYILVKMVLDDNSWLAVRTTQGVTGFVGMGNKPTPISMPEVQSIVKFMSQGSQPTYKTVFSDGDTVKIVDGPFAEFIGKVDNVDQDRGKVRVLVSIFGRETPVELDFLQVQKL